MAADYARAAEWLDYSTSGCLQYEYGIFGGDDGGGILDFIRGRRQAEQDAAC